MRNQRIKTAFVHNFYTPYRLEFFELLSKNPTFELLFFFGRESDPLSKANWGSTRKRCFAYKILPSFPIRIQNVFFIINPSLPFELIGGRFDAITAGASEFVGTQVAFLVSKTLRRPFILWETGTVRSMMEFEQSVKKSLFKFIALNIMRYIRRHCDSYITFSGSAINYLVTKEGIAKDKIFVATNFASFNKPTDAYWQVQQDLKKSFGIKDESVFIYVGKLGKDKRVDLLIKAFANLRTSRYNVLLLIVGDGSYKNDLQLLCKSLKVTDYVHFTGWVDREELPPFILLSDALVLPKHGGIVIMEAMALGKPVISNLATGEFRTPIIEGKTGFLVQEDNVNSLEAAMARFLTDSKLKDSMMLNIKKTFAFTYSSKAMVDNFIEAIRYAYNKTNR